MLHFAPENFLREKFKLLFKNYVTADLYRDDVDFKEDIQSLSFDNESFDIVFASHVMEHIADDHSAIKEIHRVLKPNGIAILPVPIMGIKTIEYDTPDPEQDYHVRAPGLDYFNRYNIFGSIKIVKSEDIPLEYQPFVYSKNAEKSPFIFKDNMENDFVPICKKI